MCSSGSKKPIGKSFYSKTPLEFPQAVLAFRGRFVKQSKNGETFRVLVRLIDERKNFQKGVYQWKTVKVATAVSLMVMTKA